MSDKKLRIAIFASGNGTNAEAIFNYFQNHGNIEVRMLLSNNPTAYALERARKFGVKWLVFDKSQFRESDTVVEELKNEQITHIVLAGFMWLVPLRLVQAFPHRIINIHPALLPKFGGKGMYGMNVHEAVKSAGEKESGITIHEVNEKYDEGKILFQAKCPVLPGDSPGQIARKVHELEYAHYPKTIETWIQG